MTVDKLWVMWRDEGNQRHAVAQLWRERPGEFRFAYMPVLPTDFRLLAEFPANRTEAEPYVARHLFATFAERIPSPKRPDYARILDSWGIDNRDDQLEILARAGGIQATDWLELVEWRSEDDDLRQPLLARVAGTGHWPGYAHAKEGDELTLRREPENPRDRHATELFLASGEKLGYVPKPYTDIVARLIDGGVDLRATILRRLGLESSYPRLQLRIERA